MKYLIIFLWFLLFFKKLFFWVWLWQLKEYHVGRFKAHFQTTKGKNIINKYLLIAEAVLILGLFFYDFFVYVLVLVFLAEILKSFYSRDLRIPVITKKTSLILGAGFILEILIIIYFSILPDRIFYIALLTLSILSPLFFSGLIFSFEPFAIFWRNKTIKKATQKIKEFKNLKVIGITGSYGKTSTKEFLAQILSEKFKVVKTKEHQNSEVGVSRCVLNDIKAEHQIFICEMGAYQKGGIKLLCDIVSPKIGIVTGVNEQHLATFGNMENLLSAEGGKELIDSLPKEGVAFFNEKNEYCRDLYEKSTIRKILYGREAAFSGGENILGAMAVAKEIGMKDEEIFSVVKKIKNKFPGIEIKKISNLNIIDATYSANPNGVLAHLEYLKSFKGKRVIIMPCLIELGEKAKEIHFKIGEKIGEVCDLTIITTEDFFEEIKEGAMKKEMKEENILFMESPKEIFERIKNFSNKEDVILLESRIPKKLFNFFK
ncbi:MAG: Mur ligase family protein [Candidatus Nealsonbacteria bacterium]|nr:Mur ligase family protein [Candidatus Nealsonbacteria bacterium]